MKYFALSVILLFGINVTHAQEKMGQYQAPVAKIRQAALSFLEGLSPELRKKVMFTLEKVLPCLL